MIGLLTERSSSLLADYIARQLLLYNRALLTVGNNLIAVIGEALSTELSIIFLIIHIFRFRNMIFGVD